MKNIASPFLRFLAYLIDLAFSCMPFLLILVLISNSTDVTLFLNNASLLIVFLAYPVFYAILTSLMVSTFGGTFGKLLTGTAIVNSNGQNLSFWKAVWRNLIGYTVSGIVLWAGFVWILFDKDRQGWHDMMADSYVVVKNKSLFVLGIIVMIFLLFIQISLVKNSIRNFKSNSALYTEIYNDINTNLKENSPAE